MNENRNSIIYLCNDIKLDRKYKNVLDYSEADMVTLCRNNAIASRLTFSFIKHGENRIKVDFTYNDCLRANYIAFQNPDYSNKWFFAFIDKVEFVSPSTTILHYTIDEWSTWFKKLTLERCYVIREHVNDDTIGKHKIDEGLALGDYKVQSHLADSYNNDLCVIMGMSEDMYNNYALGVNNYNGIPAPLFYYRWDLTDADMTAFTSALQALASGKTDAIVSMFLAPKWLAPYRSTTRYVDTSTSVATQNLGISRITTIDGLTPKNNKTLCYPYCYIGLSNGVGNYIILEQEDWELDSNNEMVLTMYGVLNSGCSIKAVPINYKGNGVAWDESISVGKYPALAWANDIYTNWQTQNGINILGIPIDATTGKTAVGGIKALAGASTGDIASLGSGIGDMVGALQEDYRMSMIPAGVRGSLNTGDALVSAGANRLHAYRVTIEYEFAKAIDDFFTLFGYKVNTLKTPNITGRRYWNFIQIGASEVLGYGNIPHEALDTINNIARAGTTIWHNHTYLGNYALNNDII